jgi:hypothetical protein
LFHLEARTIRSNQPSKEEAKEVEAGRFPPDQWVGLAKDYRNRLRKLHGLPE